MDGVGEHGDDVRAYGDSTETHVDGVRAPHGHSVRAHVDIVRAHGQSVGAHMDGVKAPHGDGVETHVDGVRAHWDMGMVLKHMWMVLGHTGTWGWC